MITAEEARDLSYRNPYIKQKEYIEDRIRTAAREKDCIGVNIIGEPYCNWLVQPDFIGDRIIKELRNEGFTVQHTVISDECYGLAISWG